MSVTGEPGKFHGIGAAVLISGTELCISMDIYTWNKKPIYIYIYRSGRDPRVNQASKDLKKKNGGIYAPEIRFQLDLQAQNPAVWL